MVAQALCSAIPVQCYSCNMTMMAYIKSHSANNPLLHAVHSKSQPLKLGQCASVQAPRMPTSSVQRRKQGSLFPSELGFSMNVDWHQEATLGPQSLLKTLAACQRSSNFATQRKPCWQLVRSQGVTWRPGGNNIFQNAQANRPMMGD